MSRVLIINNLNERGQSINALHFRWSAPSDIALDELICFTESIKSYYKNPLHKNSKDVFSLASYHAVSGISADDLASIKAFESMSGEKYDGSSVNASCGLISFDKDVIKRFLINREAKIDIIWSFDKNGNPDLSNTKIDISELFDNVSFHMIRCLEELSDDEISNLLQNEKHIKLRDLSIEEIAEYQKTLPEYWYNGYNITRKIGE
ncbi:hypothetical protein [Mogibacterium diversum]|uniref:hypothetical protein n=1 Tax=Mogibacterium diversum TaxID=114527 RepID=UPI0028D76741|nr:hypothetical protein [Mogibacterium diversum]